MIMKLPNDTLYLPIKQVYFDQIIDGTKKEEFREIKMGITANKYLMRVIDDNGNPIKDTNDIEGHVRDEKYTDANISKYILQLGMRKNVIQLSSKLTAIDLYPK